MERATKIIETPGGHKVEVYEYLTAGDERKVQRVFLRTMKVSRPTPGASGKEISEAAQKAQESLEISGDMMLEAQDVTLRCLVKSVDGCVSEVAYDRLMALRPAEAKVVIEAIEALTGDTEKKTDKPPPSAPSSPADASPTTS